MVKVREFKFSHRYIEWIKQGPNIEIINVFVFDNKIIVTYKLTQREDNK